MVAMKFLTVGAVLAAGAASGGAPRTAPLLSGRGVQASRDDSKKELPALADLLQPLLRATMPTHRRASESADGEATPSDVSKRGGLLGLLRPPAAHAAMVLPADNPAGALGSVLAEGTFSFFSIYANIITARIILSWIPQAQGVAVLRPLFVSADVYLNLFRGIVPPIFGLDISPIGAFIVLDLLRQNLGAVAMEPGMAFAQLPGVRAAGDALRKHLDAEGLAMPMLE
jgi:YggT family protein